MEQESKVKLIAGTIIFLCETWSQYEIKVIPNFLSDYGILGYSSAVKEKSVGRASGGLSVFVKKSLMQYSRIIHSSNLWIIIELNTHNRSYIIFFTYLKPSLHDACIDLITDMLLETVDTYNFHDIVVIGDFNSHIGQLNQIHENIFTSTHVHEVRKSLHLTTNSRGIKLVSSMENLGLYTLNGRTKLDIPGNFSFISKIGKSTIDQAWANISALENIVSFQLDQTLSTSNHSICTIQFNDLLSPLNHSKELNSKLKYNIQFKFDMNLCPSYQNYLNTSTNLYFHSNNPNDLALNLESTIKNAACNAGMLKVTTSQRCTSTNHAHKPWYDRQCLELKRKCNQSHRNLKTHFSDTSLRNFISDKKIYLDQIKKSKLSYTTQLKIGLSNVKNPQEFWTTVRLLKPFHTHTNNIKITDWEQFYLNFFTVSTRSNISFLDCLHPYFDVEFTLDELQRSIQKSKLKKSPGMDSLTNEFYKNLTPAWQSYLLNLFNTVLNTEKIPDSWCNVYISLLHKKGDTSDPLNYRGIAVVLSICKLFTSILYTRLQEWSEMNFILNECQSGFRKSRGTRDNLFILSSIINLRLRLKSTNIFALFVDLRRAFDSINHNLLWYKLYNLGISSKIIRILQYLYNNAIILLKINDDLSNPIDFTKGVLQGEIMSPFLFACFINDIWSYFEKSGAQGINIDGHNSVTILAYADDKVILGDSAIDVQKKLTILSQYCEINKLEVNVSKTKVIHFHKGRAKRIKPFMYNNKEIEMVTTYNYLGTIFSSSGKYNIAANTNFNKTIIAFQKVKSLLCKGKSEGWDEKLKLIQSIAHATFLYSSEIWALRYFNIVERAQTYLLKCILRLPKNTPHYQVRLETGAVHLWTNVLKRSLNWWSAILKMPDDRLPKIIYSRLKSLDNYENNKIEFNWYTQLKNFFQDFHEHYIWHEQKINKHTIDEITNSLALDLKQKDFHRLSLSSFSFHYKLIKVNYETESYLSLKMPVIKTQIICQIRLACDRGLKIFYRNMKYELDSTQFCLLCNRNKQEDIYHFFIECPLYNNIRDAFLSRYFSNSQPDIICFINFLKILDAQKIDNIFYYTLNAFKTRSFCLFE